ncbi:hypothetical protein KPH14_009208 [Odynerus spinipes]|uniref:Odorant receptor n=1 Tax=Odynerus spinipes TaxID=1348599 RepID=A0AAD9VQE9_9HYME|nr:hypothetical protein KPH14_009208 [Odynerus spinipes]
MKTNDEEKHPYTEDHYYKYVNLSIELNRWILQSLGVWPEFKETTWKEKYFRRAKNAIFYFLMIFVFLPCGPYVILEIESTYDKLRLTGPLSFCIMAVLKYLFLTLHENDFRRCVEYIETDWKNAKHSEDKKIMIANAHSGRSLATLCAAFAYGAATFYYIALPITSGKIFAPDVNISYRPLPFPVTRIFLDARYSPVNEIVIFLQCLYGFAAHSIAAGTCSLAAVCTMHACGQLQVLMNWLEHLVDGREDMCDDLDKRMANIIQRHVHTLDFISMTEELLNKISLVEIVGCTLNMCLLGYYCIMEWDVSEVLGCLTYVIILTSVTFNIFIFCYIGELLTEQCAKLGDRSYMIDWYHLPGKKSQALILIISMSRITTKLTAGNLMELSLNSFSDVSIMKIDLE